MNVSVEQYLNTSYEPDVEYVDGALVERNVGDWQHSLIQSNIIFALRTKYPHLKAVAGLRSRTSETRFRLPGVTVLQEESALAAIEILSDGDRMSAMMEKFREYDTHGIPNIWVIDPRLLRLYTFNAGEFRNIVTGELSTAHGEISLTAAEIFQA